ncbi:UNKNOWN [Stylonychia lemnae]|uniref:Uncharacterized protein n=1 Tax=Stylonychia lemnae TaxID=5949 RepID=A0A077ZXU8_STYLE|nr:UNKNOWN [Stylonychia lemnae]|eukprot:CDW74412.1 UNKNOWN [Stylonychia lemnae]
MDRRSNQAKVRINIPDSITQVEITPSNSISNISPGESREPTPNARSKFSTNPRTIENSPRNAIKTYHRQFTKIPESKQTSSNSLNPQIIPQMRKSLINIPLRRLKNIVLRANRGKKIRKIRQDDDDDSYSSSLDSRQSDYENQSLSYVHRKIDESINFHDNHFRNKNKIYLQNDAKFQEKLHLAEDRAKRNKQMYDILRQNKVCVLPDPKIQTHDQLPRFDILETEFQDESKKKERKLRVENNKRFKIKTIQSVDFDTVNKPPDKSGLDISLREFEQFLNLVQTRKVLAKIKDPKKKKDFQSPSISVNDYSLLKNRLLTQDLNHDLGLGKYVSKQLERKIEILNRDNKLLGNLYKVNTAISKSIGCQSKYISVQNVTYETIQEGILSPISKIVREDQNQFAMAYSQQKKNMELQMVKENYKNLSTFRVLDRLSFDSKNYDQDLFIYKKNYKFQHFQNRLQFMRQRLNNESKNEQISSFSHSNQ